MSHALQRFRERVDPAATQRDLEFVLAMAIDVHRQWVSRGRAPGTPGVINRSDEGAVEALLLWRGIKFRAVYVPHQKVIRTILPGW